MADPRLESYARLLVRRCVQVQPGWQVLVAGSPLARPLLEEVVREVARAGAYALVRVNLRPADGVPGDPLWAAEAPEELVTELAPIQLREFLEVEAYIAVVAPENTREGADLPRERMALARRSVGPIMPRMLSHELRWVSCQYPTPALAQEAGMTLEGFADFLYGAVLVDVEAQHARLERIRDRFEGADRVRVVGAQTDLSFSVAGRTARIDAGDGSNVPGGEVFFSPVEDSVEGYVTFAEYPAVYGGRQVHGARLEFRGGRVVEAGAEDGGEFLLAVLGTDEGARRLGEFGIGGNPGIVRHMKNTLFDEKIDGTVHFALGAGFPDIGGRNESAVHWDMVKDLRAGGEIWVDGELVQKDGEWRI